MRQPRLKVIMSCQILGFPEICRLLEAFLKIQIQMSGKAKQFCAKTSQKLSNLMAALETQNLV
jgi:hypothetical protein